MPKRSLPPLLQGLAEVHAVRERLNELNFWQGRPFSFLHFEKTAGTSLVRMLESYFHPLQINLDADRGAAPHILSGFLPGQCEEVRRTAFVWGHYDLPALRRIDPARAVVTVLREPRARVLSLYHFWRSVVPDDGPVGFNVAAAQQHDLLAFLRSDDPLIRNYIDNVYVRRLTGHYVTPTEPDSLHTDAEQTTADAMRALDGLAWVGLVEKHDGLTALLGRAIGASLPDRLPHHNAAEDPSGAPSPGYRRAARMPITPEVAVELDRLTRYDTVIYRRALTRLEATA